MIGRDALRLDVHEATSGQADRFSIRRITLAEAVAGAVGGGIGQQLTCGQR